MTEHTPKQIAHAERIVQCMHPKANTLLLRALEGVALAAIVEVSELAAKWMCDNHDRSATSLADDIRNGDHLP